VAWTTLKESSRDSSLSTNYTLNFMEITLVDSLVYMRLQPKKPLTMVLATEELPSESQLLLLLTKRDTLRTEDLHLILTPMLLLL